jgi:hypothetical protein
MTLEQYSYLSQIIGVIVVVATLLYLSIQVRQGKELLRSEARQVQVNNDQNNVYQFIEHTELATSYVGGTEATFEEKARLAFWIVASMRAREHEWLQYKEGTLDRDGWMAYRGVIYFTLGTERARAIWKLISQFFNQEFAAMVAEMMDGVPCISFWEELRATP